MKTQDTVSYDASSALILTNKAQSCLLGAKDFIIDSQEMFEIASGDLKHIKQLQKEVEEKRTGITGPLNQAVKAVNDLFRSPKEFLDSAEKLLKNSIVKYTTEQGRLAAEARRKAEEAARAERERLAAIEREQQEVARKAAEAARAAQEAGDTSAAMVLEAEAQDAQMQAEVAALTAQVVTSTPEVETPAKVSGISGRVNYSAEVADLLTLVKAVAEGKAPLECLQADTKFLNAQARAFKKEGELYPGVKIIAERTISARSM